MSGLRDPEQHDDLLNYQLKKLLTIGGAPAIRLCEGRYGISRVEWRVIAALVEDGPMSPSRLAERCWPLDAGRVSKTITGLTTKGLVERGKLANDRHRAIVGATDSGRRLYDALFPQLVEINLKIMVALDPDESLVLERCLRKLTDRARQIHDEGGGVDARAERRLGGSRRFWT